MRKILSIVVLFGFLVALGSDAYASRPRLLKKMTKPPVCQKKCK